MHHTFRVGLGQKAGDETAIRKARSLGMPTLVYEADWKALGRSAGPIRNRQIVIGSDHVVAFWDELFRGTADLILASHLQGKLAKVYGA